MKAKVLIDNIAENGLKGEWGLSVYIEHNGHRILLDTGSGSNFYGNALKLGIKLEETDFAVLSHAHYDHADGMEEFFRHNSRAKLYLRKECKENCYGRKLIFSRYIGIKKGYLEAYRDRLVYVDDDSELVPGVYLVGHKTPGLEAIGKKAGMYTREDGRWQVESFAHEQSLVVDTEKGLVVFNSCCHGGADNIINEIKSTFPDKKIYAIFGGFHLFESKKSDVVSLAESIKATGIEQVYTGHCTGDKAFSILRKELGEMAHQIYAGMEVEF